MPVATKRFTIDSHVLVCLLIAAFVAETHVYANPQS